MIHETNNTHKPRGRIACQDPNKTDKAGRTKIFGFTSSGSLDKVIELIEKGANVNHRDNAGWAPLHEAALKGQFEIAQHLINSGAIVNVRGFEDDTPLHDACSYGFANCVKLLVDHGADVYALNNEKKRPVDVCEDKACIKIIKQKMKELDRMASRDSKGQTCLHRASMEGSIEKVKKLLSQGANTNATDSFNWTPLHYSAEKGHLDIVKLLINHGADVNSLTRNNTSVLHLACQNGHDKVVHYFLQDIPGVNLDILDEHGQTPYSVSDSATIRQIITAKIDQERKLRATTEAIDEITFVSNTKQKRVGPSLKKPKDQDSALSREERKIQAIMKAFERAEKKQQSKRGSIGGTSATDENNNNVNINSNNSNENSRKRKSPSSTRQSSVESVTAAVATVTVATVSQHKKQPLSIATTVDPAKLDPFKKDTSGRTQLHKWSIKGNVKVVAALLKAGANPNETDNAGYTPLHEASLRGKTEVVRILLEENANVNCKGTDQDTPLHDATENGYPDVVCLLLQHGADTSLKNAKGLAPIEIAQEQDNKEIEELLRNYKEISKPKKRKLTTPDRNSHKHPESPTSPIGFDMSAKKAHARQLSGQHLPKKSLFQHQLIKTETITIPPDGPHTPIPTPPPEQWQHRITNSNLVVKKEEDSSSSTAAATISNRLYSNTKNQHSNEDLYPSIHCASRYLPLYTIQLADTDNDQHFFVVDLQISLLLGVTTHEFTKQYPHLTKRQIQSKEKERLWSPLSSMVCSQTATEKSKETAKKEFLSTDIYFVRLDQVVSMIKNDYSHLSKSLITITLDIGYGYNAATASLPITNTLTTPATPTTPTTTSIIKMKPNIKLPPKFALKMKKLNNNSNYQ